MKKGKFAYISKEQRKCAYEILETVSMSEKRKELTGVVGRCIANNAKLLLIDESVAGIDRDNQLKIIQLVKQLKRQYC